MLSADVEQQMLRQFLDTTGGQTVRLLNQARGTARQTSQQLREQRDRYGNVVRQRGQDNARRIVEILNAFAERLRDLERQQGGSGGSNVKLKARQDSLTSETATYEQSDMFWVNHALSDAVIEPLATKNQTAFMPPLAGSDYASAGYNFDGYDIADFGYGAWWEDVALQEGIKKMNPENVRDIVETLPGLSFPSLNLETGEWVDALIFDDSNTCPGSEYHGSQVGEDS